ncbi:hypothetical protein [Embleya sp. NBC_00896]|uniref:hypothetical protein n=1 Tax=Embleya sp. NBC_00896 TaxID=2975961 RepID=UPI00386F0070|nr:hypothetical protein OG928_22145 [Embleya sp. NBC_00896]
MRTFKAGLIAALMCFGVAACGGDDDGGFGGLGGLGETTKTSDSAAPTSKEPTGKATDDSTRRPSDRPTTSRPRTTAPVDPPTTSRGSGANDWNPTYSRNFLNGCLSTSGNNTKYCQCALTELQGKYTQADMNAFDQEYARTNKLPAELQTAVSSCLNR